MARFTSGFVSGTIFGLMGVPTLAGIYGYYKVKKFVKSTDRDSVTITDPKISYQDRIYLEHYLDALPSASKPNIKVEKIGTEEYKTCIEFSTTSKFDLSTVW